MLTLNLGPHLRTPRKFRDFDDLYKFALQNVEEWRSKAKPETNTFGHFIDPWNSLIDAINMFRNNAEHWPEPRIAEEGHRHFRHLQLVPVDSPAGQAALAVFEAMGSEGVRGFASYLFADQVSNFINGSLSKDFFSGAMIGWATENNLSKSGVIGLRKSTQQIHARAEEQNGLAIDQLRDFRQTSNDQINEAKAHLLRETKVARRAMGMLLAHFRRVDSERDAAWEALNDAYNEKIKLDAAVKLWSDQSAVHEGKYNKLRYWAVGVGLGGLVCLAVWVLLSTLFAGWLFGSMSAGAGPSGLRISWPYEATMIAASTLIYSTIYLWTLRLIIRTMMAENHLAIDAKARSSMAHTYLALIKDNAAEKDDRPIILASLFRPVTDGLVRDDAMPVISPAGLATRGVSG